MTPINAFSTDETSLTWRITPDLLCVVSADGILRQTNPAWIATLGRGPDDIESRQFIECVHPDDIARTQLAFQDVLTGRPVLNFENRYQHKDGSYRWLSWNVVPEGNTYFCTARDVTALKEAEEQLALQDREMNLRRQFMSMLGPDLNAPLSTIVSSLRALGRWHKETTSVHTIEQAQRATQRITSLVGDMQDFTRFSLGAGQVEMQIEPDAALRPALAAVVERARRANPFATFEESYTFTDPVACDLLRIGQLVTRLLDNAIQHGLADSPITVQAFDGEDGDFVLTVTNKGAAITPATLELLFKPFDRSKTKPSRGGLAIGLYIAAQIAQSHDGDLKVASSETETVFRLTFPRG